MTRFIQLQRGRWLGSRAHPAQPLELSGSPAHAGRQVQPSLELGKCFYFSNPVTI